MPTTDKSLIAIIDRISSKPTGDASLDVVLAALREDHAEANAELESQYPPEEPEPESQKKKKRKSRRKRATPVKFEPLPESGNDELEEPIAKPRRTRAPISQELLYRHPISQRSNWPVDAFRSNPLFLKAVKEMIERSYAHKANPEVARDPEHEYGPNFDLTKCLVEESDKSESEPEPDPVPRGNKVSKKKTPKLIHHKPESESEPEPEPRGSKVSKKKTSKLIHHEPEAEPEPEPEPRGREVSKKKKTAKFRRRALNANKLKNYHRYTAEEYEALPNKDDLVTFKSHFDFPVKTPRDEDPSTLPFICKEDQIDGNRLKNAIETGSDEVKQILLHEFYYAFQCKTCGGMFRSYEGMTSHKRTECRQSYPDYMKAHPGYQTVRKQTKKAFEFCGYKQPESEGEAEIQKDSDDEDFSFLFPEKDSVEIPKKRLHIMHRMPQKNQWTEEATQEATDFFEGKKPENKKQKEQKEQIKKTGGNSYQTKKDTAEKQDQQDKKKVSEDKKKQPANQQVAVKPGKETTKAKNQEKNQDKPGPSRMTQEKNQDKPGPSRMKTEAETNKKEKKGVASVPDVASVSKYGRARKPKNLDFGVPSAPEPTPSKGKIGRPPKEIKKEEVDEEDDDQPPVLYRMV